MAEGDGGAGAGAPSPAPAPAAGGDGGGGGSAGVPAPAPAAPAPAPASVLGGGAAPSPAPAPAGAPAPGPNDWVAEKYRVVKADGTFDLEASARKVAEAHGHLEKRLGSGDAPPAKVDDYKVNIPAALAEKFKADDLAKEPAFKEFLGKLHGAGLNQKQVDVAVGEFLDRSVKLQGAMVELTAAETTTKLKEVWKDQTAYDAGVKSAYRAAAAFGDIDKLLAKYGNDPDFIQFAAKVGAELGEDRAAPAGAGAMPEADVEALQKSKAYWDQADPEHAKTKERVDAHYKAKFGDKPKASGSMSFGSLL